MHCGLATPELNRESESSRYDEHSRVSAIYGGLQVGEVMVTSRGKSENAASFGRGRRRFVNLNPTGSTTSSGLAAYGTQQGGYAEFGTNGAPNARNLVRHDRISFINLNPTGAAYSAVLAMSATQEMGNVSFGGDPTAALWNGTADSFVALNPVGATSSQGFGIAGNEEVGEVQFGFGSDFAAGLWTGTASSFVNLNPAGATFSWAWATDGTHQVGYAQFGGGTHAMLWSGSADSAIDLDAALGSDYSGSEAFAVWTDGQTTYVAGDAGSSSGEHAIVWAITPEPSSIGLLCLGAAQVVYRAPAEAPTVGFLIIWLPSTGSGPELVERLALKT